MKTLRHILSLGLFGGFLFIAFGSMDDDKKIEKDVKTEIASNPAIEVNASKLFSDYEANGVAADAKYKDKILKVTGIVNTIDKDITDNIYVTLKGDEMFGDIQCFFSEDYLEAAANLSKGQKITVTGKCDGKLMNVMLKGCSIN